MATQIDILIKRLNKLMTVLNTSGLQQTNPPLYQLLKELIGAILQNATGVIEITGGGGGGPINNNPFVTWNNALAALPNSRLIVAGDNITLDLTTFGEILISALLDQEFLTASDETATLPNSRELLAGTGITFDDTVPNERTINADAVDTQWSVLTNGDVDNPELVFAGGDVIMTHIP